VKGINSSKCPVNFINKSKQKISIKVGKSNKKIINKGLNVKVNNKNTKIL
jgi:hypothetical protein